MAGRKPLPTNIKVLHGEKRKKRLNPDGVEAPIEVPSPPTHLSVAARQEWDRIAPELERLGILAKIDQTALANFCQATARLARAERQLEKEELIIYTDKGSSYQNPLVGVVNRLYDITRQYASEFGMTPSSRSRVKATKPNEPAKNKWSNLG
jgi:P27 family predicted phage terminase small subunit